MPSPLRQRLKEHTLKLHQDIEKKMSILVSPELSLFDYGQVLTYLYFIHRQFEEFLNQVSMQRPEISFSYSAQSPNIKRDLEILGLSLPTLPEKNIFRLNGMTPSKAKLYGMLYVFEGSKLGGQVIYRHVRDHLKLEDNALSFFRGNGNQTGGSWMSFLKELEDLEDSSHQETVEGAEDVFGIMIQNFADTQKH